MAFGAVGWLHGRMVYAAARTARPAPRTLDVAGGGHDLDAARHGAGHRRRAGIGAWQVPRSGAPRGVVIAGGQVHIAAQTVGFAAYHQHHLGVGLESDHAVDDLHAGFLQAVGQAEVGFFVVLEANDMLPSS